MVQINFHEPQKVVCCSQYNITPVQETKPNLEQQQQKEKKADFKEINKFKDGFFFLLVLERVSHKARNFGLEN